MGVAAGPGPGPGPRPRREPLSRRYMGAAGAIVAVSYAVGMILRGALLPGLIGAVLAGILTFLVLREASERHQRHQRERERRADL